MASLSQLSDTPIEWEIYHSEDEDDGPDLVPPPSPILTPIKPLAAQGNVLSIGARIQAVTLLESGMPHHQVTAFTHVSKSRIYSLRQQAIDRGWDPKVSKVVEVHHVEDAKRSGRPKTSPVVGIYYPILVG
jgi:hypothetical protein